MTQTGIIEALNDLYINRRNLYLKQTQGSTYTLTAGKRMQSKKGGTFKIRPLVDSMLADHLRGKATYGVFSTHETKFILFDFDFKDDFDSCKWYYYKVYTALVELGIDDKYIYTTFSGGKGLHVTLYMDEPMKVVDAERFYLRVLEAAELSHMTGNIEYRPKATQGVKLPLGLHYKTGKRVCFVENMNVENELPAETILSVNKIPLEALYDVLQTVEDDYTTLTDERVIERSEVEILPNVKPLEVYGLGTDSEFTIDYYNELLVNGLKAKGSRHKATFQLILFLKTHYGLDETDTTARILQWLHDQDTSLYDTPLDEAIQDTLEMVDYIYTHDSKLTATVKELIVTVDELRTILTAKRADGKNFTQKQKTVMFALLMHAKRYTSEGNRTFYMTYDQITEVTGFAKRDAISKLITDLEEQGYIAVHRRGEAQSGTYRKLPNMYEVLFMAKENTEAFRIATSENLGISRVTTFTGNTLKDLISEHFTAKQLRQMLPRKQAEYFILIA